MGPVKDVTERAVARRAGRVVSFHRSSHHLRCFRGSYAALERQNIDATVMTPCKPGRCRLLREGVEPRLADSIETALELADGLLFVEDAKTAERHTYSAKFACPVSGFTIDEIEPRLFSFNNPFGACPSCDGLGTEMYFDPQLVVPQENLPLGKAVAPWANSSSVYYGQTLKAICEHYKVDIEKHYSKLPKEVQQVVLYGSGKTEITIAYNDGKRSYQVTKPFEGVIPNMERRWRETDSSWVRDELGKYQTVTGCSDCGGHRLRPEALAVKNA